MGNPRHGRYRCAVLLDVCDQYAIQAELFSLAIANDTPVPTPIADAVANMRVIEAVLRSAESGSLERVTASR